MMPTATARYDVPGPRTRLEYKGIQELLRRTQVMSYVLVPKDVRAMLFLHAGKVIASNLDYDLPFIPVVMVISPIRIGMCMLLSRREQRSPKTEAVDMAPAEPGTLLPRVQ
jgi:glutamate transport system permease protein